MKIVKEHDDVKKFVEVAHYESHPDRVESAEFRKLKEEFHKEHAKCFINNGRCEGNIEIHHNVIEYSASEGIDWEKVKKEHGFDHVDDKKQMLPLCEKHHRHPGYGIHTISYPIWILQKFMNEEALDDFEKAVEEQLRKD